MTNALLAADFRHNGVFRALDFVNGLVAPTFLFCAGYAVATVHRFRSPVSVAVPAPVPVPAPAAVPVPAPVFGLRRSLVLLALGYLLHASGALRGDWASVFQVDVLQVIAISLLLIALIMRTPGARGALAVMALMIALVTPSIRAIDTTGWLPLLRPYVTDAVPSQFPLFPWAAFAFAGAACARVSPKWMWKIGVVAVIGGGWLSRVTWFVAHDFYRADPGVAIERFGIVALVAWSLSLLDARSFGKADAVVNLFGRRSLFVYIAHIAIVYGTHPLSLRSLIGPTLGPLACVLVWLAVTATMALAAAKVPRLKLY